MSKLTFILGGAGSGKSRFAMETAKKTSKKVIFVATARPSDQEMKNKIKNHKNERPGHWQTVEAAETPFEMNGSGNTTVRPMSSWFLQAISASKLRKKK